MHYTVIYMPKKSFYKYLAPSLMRVGGLVIAGLFILVVIFAFTRPILAPGAENLNGKNDIEKSNNAENTFDSIESDNINPTIGVGVKAHSYLLYDESSGKILAARNPNSAFAIASITKLMTAFVTQKYGNLSDEWIINNESNIDIRPILGLRIGDKIIVKELFNSMLIGSANDAAAALGAYISSITKTSVTDLMNTEAKKLGMDSTHYENPIGFDSEQNYSTANDLKKLLTIVQPMQSFEDLDRKEYYSFSSQLGNTYSVKATNSLLAGDSDIHAIKTGFTDEAQGAMITAIHHGDKKFIIIVLNSPDRESDTLRLKKQMLEQYGII